jgi:N-acetyl-anhydromuramyl-L-alanine amidase AmpD
LTIERGEMKIVRGIIVHHTGGSTAASSLESYKNPRANGAHFLIERDGTIYQTAPLGAATPMRSGGVPRSVSRAFWRWL